MIRQSLLFICCSLFVGVSPAVSDTHENVARFLPADVAFFGTLNSPSDVLDVLASVVEWESPSLEEIADLLLLTDLTDGSKRVFDSSDLGLDLLKADSIHLVVFDSRSGIGPFAILIDQGQTEVEISEPLWRLVFRFLSQVIDSGLPNNAHAGQLQEVMSKWECTLTMKTSGRWTVIASDSQLTSDLVEQISNDKTDSKSLAADRRFLLSSSTSLSDSCLKFYVSPYRARQIALSADFERETVWDGKKRDEIPWIASSIRINATSESLVLDKKTVIAATVPLSGENKYWDFYRPIEEFPVLWDDVHTVLGKCVDLESWNDLARRELDDVYGKGTLARYDDNPVSAFRTGLSRPKLGALSFSIMDSKNPRNLRLLKIGNDVSDEIIMGYLNDYFPALQQNLEQGGYETSYSKTEFRNLPGWWSQETKDKESGEEKGNGALILDGWVAIGSFAQINQIANLENGSARITGNSPLRDRIMGVSDRMGFAMAPHEFGFYRSNTVSAEMRAYASGMLQRVFPAGWHISQNSRERGLQDADVRRKMTRPQLFGLYVTGIIDAIARHEIEYVKVNSISIDKDRFEVGETFTLNNSSGGVPAA